MILSISTILAMLLTRVPDWGRGSRMRGFGSLKPSFWAQTGTGSALHVFCWTGPSPHCSVTFQRRWENSKKQKHRFLKTVLGISTFLLVAISQRLGSEASVSMWYKNGARGRGSSKSFENLFKSDRRLILTIINRLHAWDSHADTNRMRYRRFSCRFQYFTKDSLTNSTRWYPSGVSKAFLSKVLKSA